MRLRLAGERLPLFLPKHGRATVCAARARLARKRRLSASFSFSEQSRARSEGTVNIQMDHMPCGHGAESIHSGQAYCVS